MSDEYLVLSNGKWEICHAAVFMVPHAKGERRSYYVCWADRQGALVASNEDTEMVIDLEKLRDE